MKKDKGIKNFELKVRNKSILIFDIRRRTTDRKPNYQYCYSYIDVEVNPKRRIPSATRIIDAYNVNDFKERLSKLFTKALKRGLPEQIIPEEIFEKFYPQLVDYESPSRYKRKDREDLKRFVRPHATFHENNEIEHCRESDLKKLLIVDEEEDILIPTEKYLQFEKYDTITCSNGYDALSILEEKRDEIALVLLDIMLPGIKGYEILTKIKSKYPEIRVVLFTLKDFFDVSEIKRCRECGAVGDEIRTNRPPIIILNNDLSAPKYTCKRCGYNWGSTL